MLAYLILLLGTALAGSSDVTADLLMADIMAAVSDRLATHLEEEALQAEGASLLEPTPKPDELVVKIVQLKAAKRRYTDLQQSIIRFSVQVPSKMREIHDATGRPLNQTQVHVVAYDLLVVGEMLAKSLQEVDSTLLIVNQMREEGALKPGTKKYADMLALCSSTYQELLTIEESSRNTVRQRVSELQAMRSGQPSKSTPQMTIESGPAVLEPLDQPPET